MNTSPLRLLLPSVLLLLVAQWLHAQPRVAYIVPDIGTPGMSTYVELIGLHSASSAFPAAGLQSPSTMRVETVNAADSVRVVLSPVVVSWDGRMVGCHVFVRPGAALGTVALRVRWGATTSTAADFSIVAPTPFGEKIGGGVIGSGGAMGARSARGAMIVDSMVLRAGAYTFSTADPDNDLSNGNQGHLPVIVLSRGRVVVAADATLSVDAPGKHGGPGGGGGGGYGPTRPQNGLVPAVPGERDAPQGDGYAGGKSAIPVVPSPGPFGVGTGTSSKSLNDVEANSTFRTGATSARLYGSGPGHPFDSDGRSGGAAAIAAGLPPAIFGTRFGGGGNATAGSGITDLTDLNGQPVGNRQIVPFHGGAGGAGGGANDSIGGGGGGAVALFAATTAHVSTVLARGANGRNGCASCGFGSGDPSGGGSGGGVLIGARGRVEIGIVNVSGGSAGAASGSSTSIAGSGGVGRFRHDGRAIGAPGVTAGASRFVGPTLDTLTYVDSLYRTVTGTGRPGDEIALFVRGDAASWPLTPATTTVATDSTWTIRVRFPVDTIAFVVALQKTPTSESSTGQYSATPAYVFSQSAAAIVKVNLFARIVAPDRRTIDSVICPELRLDTIFVRNTGTAPLALGATSAFVGPNASLYTIVSPSLPDTIAPGDSVRVIVRFDGRTPRNGQLGGTLRLVTNDRLSPIFDISFDVVKEDRSYTLAPPAIDMGDVYVGTTKDSLTVYRNGNTYRDTIVAITPMPGSSGVLGVLAPTLPSIQSGGVQRDIVFRFAPSDTGRFTARFRVTTRPCSRDTIITTTGYARSAVITSRPTVTFDSLTCADSAVTLLAVRNTGNAAMTLHYPVLTGADRDSFRLAAPTASTFPRTVAIGDSVVFTVAARNASGRSLTAALVFLSNDSLAGKNPWVVALDGSRDQLVITPADTVIDFGTVCVGETSSRIALLHNRSLRTRAAVVAIERTNYGAPFRIVPEPTLPLAVAAADSTALFYSFAPLAAGAFTDTVTVRLEPCDRLVRIVARGIAVERTVGISVSAIDFADVRVGDAVVDTVVLTNTRSSGTMSVDAVALALPNAALTILHPTSPVNRILAPGDTLQVLVRFSPTVSGPLSGDSLRVITSGSCDGASVLPISGTGVVSAAVVTRSSLSLRSGPCDAPRAVEDTLSVVNRGSAPLTIESVTAAPAPFVVIDPTSGFPLAPGASRVIRVRYLPGAAAVTPTAGSLTIRSSDPDRPEITVALSGRRDTAAIAAAPSIIDFGTVLACETPRTATITLRNDGTLEDTVGVATPGVVQVSPAPPYRIAPGRDTTITVMLLPGTGDLGGALELVGSLCGTRTTIDVRGEREEPSIVADDVDFGDVAVGSSARAWMTITNPHAVPMRVVAAVASSPEITVVAGQLPLMIGAGASGRIELAYAPAAAGDLPPTTLTLSIDSVCALTVTADARGRGITGGIAISRRSLEYGAIVWCRDGVDSLSLRNIGSQPVAIRSALIDIGGGDFTLVSTPSYPVTLTPGDSLLLAIRFAPAAAPDGARAGTLRVLTDDAERPELTVELSGERTSEMVAFGGGAFPPVAAGGRGSTSVTVRNSGTAPLALTAASVAPPFSVTSTTPRLPTTLAPGDSLMVDLELAPGQAGPWSTQLRLNGEFACDVAPEYTLSAGGTVASAQLELPAVDAVPGEHLTLPLVLSGATALDAAGALAFTAYVSFEKSVLLPTGGTPLGSVSGRRRRVAVRGLREPGQTSGIVGTLDVVAALGDTLVTDVTIDSVVWDGAMVRATLRAGLVRIHPGGGWRRFLTTGTMSVAVRPNPASGVVMIEYETIEAGHTRLVLVDPVGRTVARLVDEELPTSAHTLPLDTRGLAAGNYFLILETPSASSSVLLQIVH